MMKGLQEMIADAREEGREAARSEMMKGLQEMIADAREKRREAARSEMMKGLQEMIADAREEGRKETMNELQEMIADARAEERKAMSEMVIQRLAADYVENGYSKETIYQKLQNIFLLDRETLMEYTGQIFEG